MKCVVGTVCLLFSVTLALTSEYVYEFGYNVGNVIYSKDGHIPLLKPNTKVNIPRFGDYTVTYVKVTVNALAPPKVDYDSDNRSINIAYSWIQISESTYNIIVKGV